MNIAIIPLRKGSKGIPGKNKRSLLGRPLFSWTLYEAIKSNLDRVCVFTDDEDIIHFVQNEYCWTEKVVVMHRSEESASDTASTEFAIEEFVGRLDEDFSTLTLIQATSPMLNAEHIDECLALVRDGGYDSALTVAPSKRFYWSAEGTPINYEYLNRPRRQEMNPDFVENGACYTISREQYDLTRNRLGGKIGLVEMPEESLTEIDEPSDFHIVEMLLENRLRKSKLREIYPVVLVLDVDGVFTDAKVTYRPEMEFSKTFSMRDGKGLELVRKAGVDVVVITSEDSPIVRQRMKKLNIENVFHGVKDKYAILDNYIDENNLNWKNIAYIGDDVNDLACMLAAGLSLAPFDATSIIRSKADLVLHAEGGTGAIREATDLIISLSQRK